MQGIHFNQKSGNRRVTPGTLRASQTSRKFRNPEWQGRNPVSRIMALQVAKRAASAMGLKAAKLALIDQLFAFSKAQDWVSEGIAPVVWPSNELLARRLGVAISTMKYHLSGLVEAGLVAYTDHPTFQRKGVRDEVGQIVEAYGIDLSPIAVDYQHLLEISENAEAEARRRHALSHRRTGLRREIEAIICAARDHLQELDETWSMFQARLDQLREQRLENNQEREDNIANLLCLRDEAEQAFEALSEGQNLNSAVSNFRPLQTTADLPDSEPCNNERNCADAQSVKSSGASGAMAFEKKPAGDRRRKQAVIGVTRSEAEDDLQNISLPLIRDACPELAAWLPDALEHWSTLRRSGSTMCSLVSINPQVYREAQDLLGVDLAIVALALTVERTARGEIKNPGGYLRTLTQRGRAGDLHLSRSLFALAAQPSSQPRLI